VNATSISDFMTILPPLCITSRLCAGARFGDSEISIEFAGETKSGRIRYRYWIDAPGFEYSACDITSGVGGGSLQDGLKALLDFLSAAMESREYRESTGRKCENEDLFPPEVVDWACQNSGEIEFLQLCLSEKQLMIEP
jgi:hypothetical protein